MTGRETPEWRLGRENREQEPETTSGRDHSRKSKRGWAGVAGAGVAGAGTGVGGEGRRRTAEVGLRGSGSGCSSVLEPAHSQSRNLRPVLKATCMVEKAAGKKRVWAAEPGLAPAESGTRLHSLLASGSREGSWDGEAHPTPAQVTEDRALGAAWAGLSGSAKARDWCG